VKLDGLFSWKWQDGESDWGYPLSVDGNLFLRNEMLFLFESLQFSSPNTLEAAMQIFAELYIQRQGICFDLPRLVNIPCNVVQRDFANRHGVLSALDLLKKWQNGLAIDIAPLENLRAESVHVDHELIFMKRE
jgi:hypothetical protein